MNDCIFCKIGAGEIPSKKFYEDENMFVVADIDPKAEKHYLMIPKKHYDSFLSCPKDLMMKVYAVAQRIGQAEMAVLGAKGVNILTNCGEAAGQSVPHFHVHVIPRYIRGEGGFQIKMAENDTSGMDLPRLACDISKAIR